MATSKQFHTSLISIPLDMKRIQFLLLPLLMLALSACEKVVEIDLNDADPQIVVEAIVRSEMGDNYVTLIRSASIYEDNTFDNISGANVTIVDPTGVSHLLAETTPGRYNGSSIAGTPGTYSLIIEVEGKSISAITTMPEAVALDTVLVRESGGFGPSETFVLEAGFTDPADVRNYYRFRIFKNGVQDDGWLLYDDDIIDGNDVELPLFPNQFDLGDTTRLEMLSIDEESLRYYEALENGQGNGFFDAAPGNPESNLKGDAIGYFSAWSVASKTIVVQ